MKTVIVLGPLFTQAERIWNRLLKQAIEKEREELKVVLPQDNAKKFIKNNKVNFKALMENCLVNAKSHDIAIAILDGPDADSGTCVEIGFRKGTNRKLKVIGVRTDFRASENEGLNAMLHICDKIIYFPSFNEDVEKLAQEIIVAI
jgi:nucleoside 2-deoxyribosyltransferase